MINKRKYLGKCPDELGVKDAVHVAIVSCVAGKAIEPGARVILNNDGQAVPSEKGFGVADPFVGMIARGQNFWVMMDPDSVVTVSHSWEHSVPFTATPAPVKRNSLLVGYANSIGVTYDQLIQACSSYVKTDRKSPYPGVLSEETVEQQVEDAVEISDMWYEWSNETGYEFENEGTECCPEYTYPDGIPFEWV